MKKSKKLIFGALATASTALVVTPLVTSCSSSSDIKQVGRGDGKNFATYTFDGKTKDISFEEVLAQAATSKDGFNAFKQEIAKEIIYNWYQGIKDSSKAPQSFKDNWSTWTDSAKKAYDDKVQAYKDSHKKSWEYYFQNEVLDPVGGTKDAFIRQQMYDKVYDAFKNLVFTTNYLAYAENNSQGVNSEVNSFGETQFNTPTTWKNIGFYAKANPNYRVDTQDLDDVYATIQQQAFDAYTLAKHPQALLMALWKYAAPSDGMYTVFSTNVPASDEEKKNNNEVKASGTLGDDPQPTKTLKAKYETPAFPRWGGGEYTANAKFNQLVTDFFDDSTYAKGSNNVDKNGMFRYINQGSTYQDDGSTMGFVWNIDEMYSKLDAWFCPAVTQLYESGMAIANGTYTDGDDNFLDYKVSDLLNHGFYQSGETVDILSNFFFRANDDRLFGTGKEFYLPKLQVLSEAGVVLDLSKTFESTGDAGSLEGSGTAGDDFHSALFLNSDSAVGNYYGRGLTQQGVQWAVNALWLTDDNGNRLPYILFRDTNGVHLCGLYGAWSYNSSGTLVKGFLADNSSTYPAATYGAAWSQGRQNIMMKALNLYMKSRSESLFDISSEVKSYFTSNADDIVINMALDKITRGNTEKSVIFDFSKVLDTGIDQDTFRKVFNDSTIFFLLQGTLTSYLEANKKLYGLMSTHINNSLMSRSSQIALSKKTSDNYKNGVATPMPYIGVYNESTADGTDADLYTGNLVFPITNTSIWINATGTSTTPTYNKDPNTDTWATSFTQSTVNATNFLEQGTEKIYSAYKNIIDALGMTSAVLPSSSYAKWSEHLNPKYTYNKDNATNAIGNGLYMAINKFLDGTQVTNGIKLNAGQAYATSIFDKAPSASNFFLGEIKNTGNYKGLRDAVASMMYANKIFTSDTPLPFYRGIVSDPTQVTAEAYRTEIERLGKQSIAHSATSSSASDDLISYWTFIDTLQYLVNNDYAKLMDYLQTSVMSYGVEADLVWLCEDNKDANPSFLSKDDITDFGWQTNYYGKYSPTYLPTAVDDTTGATTTSTVSTYVDNSVYYQAAPLKYGASNTILGMGFAGLATSSSSPSAITSTLQNALFTETYKSKVTLDKDGVKDKHYGGWYKYGSLEKLTDYISKLSSVADIQKIATNLGAANEDSIFTSKVVDVVKRTTFQDGDPEIVQKLKLNGKEVVAGQALTPDVLRARLLGGSQKIGDQTISYTDVQWGLASYETLAPTGTISNLFTKFGGTGGIAAELFDVNSTRHAMRVGSDAATAGNYAKMYVIQLNNADFHEDEASGRSAVENLNYAMTGDKNDYSLLNYIAVQYAQQSSLQTQATNDVVKTILGDDNKVTVYDRRLNDKLGPTWVKNYKSTN